jgi:lactoylglutathione lyase
MITEIATAAVYVSDQKVAEDFWARKIGFEVSAKNDMGDGAYWLEVKPKEAGSALVLYPRSAMKGWEEMKPSIVFRCENFDKTFEQLQANNVNVETPMNLAWGKFLKFKDPDGNEFGVRGA